MMLSLILFDHINFIYFRFIMSKRGRTTSTKTSSSNVKAKKAAKSEEWNVDQVLCKVREMRKNSDASQRRDNNALAIVSSHNKSSNIKKGTKKSTKTSMNESDILPNEDNVQKPIIKIPDNILEVEDLDSELVCDKIAELASSIITQILSGNTFEYTVPSRAGSNQIYLEDVDRMVLGDKMSKRVFLNTSHVRKVAITTRVVQLVHEVLKKQIHITKRDLFCKSFYFAHVVCILVYNALSHEVHDVQ